MKTVRQENVRMDVSKDGFSIQAQGWTSVVIGVLLILVLVLCLKNEDSIIRKGIKKIKRKVKK